MTSSFFYQQPEVLDREKHQHLKLRTTTHSRFAAQVEAVVTIETP